MSWTILFLAGIFEIFWAVGLKYSDGFTKLFPTIFTIVTMIISFYLLSLALKALPIGTAYAVWVGIGTIGTVIAGIMLFGESMSLIRVISILFILIGIVGLKFTTN
ncbi:quaternary ammonium compound efflux SMR transporter SugE [Arcobacter cryaerophilus gv. pseudocryaerophilus]|jgi:quaternary ammonium compound-resistance protein SugE|uniref:Guanidinium exporter n=3 Tax=unclassified Arcobacter TaxID=2593671 RepID=A0AA96L1A1_9BACT|nr:quaternary ammonium compound efflux SMR transporter SugE [Arcobacter sp. AZ-2023]WPD04732.1 quaternary ammonium compound efflux SMR transporter SugE [Arcobacter sp. DSM 115956]WPD06827.1 quaternary ammonium compound efflux SMR transporter SugE [Arcobacter sp. DSM 115955]WNL31092.1 quaternary ammonium compound efflux SMR transporter SugE [Arcobacter sp. AZ-2023]WNP37242.1 quaternary ammonium compound efflux SMR transporter SugE [Arcobacter sp. AZ-2023]